MYAGVVVKGGGAGWGGCGELGRWRAEEGLLSAFDVTLYVLVDDIYSSDAFLFQQTRVYRQG